ncbi:MAG: Fic family protein [Thermoplasmata archaeon]|nr:Fic family protein [Thermoplasmata archaeon]
MAVSTARFAHCTTRGPVGYRPKSPFRPAISAPLDFAVRAGQLYTFDHELDRVALSVGDHARLLDEAMEGHPGPGRLFVRPVRSGAIGSRSRASVSRARRQFALNETRLAMEAARFRPPWSVALLQEVHASLLRGLPIDVVPGEVRTGPFQAEDDRDQLVMYGCPPERIHAELQAVLDWVDRFGAMYHPLIPSTVLFQAIYSIRPFPMGNVTTARTMAILYLRYFGLPNVALTPFVQTSGAAPDLLARLLQWTEATGSYTELVDLTLDSLLEAYAQSARRWLDPADPTRRMEEAPRRLLARARRDAGWFSVRDAVRWVGARSDQTILRHLNELVAQGFLESLGKTRGKRYRLASPAAVLPKLTQELDLAEANAESNGSASEPEVRPPAAAPRTLDGRT